MQVGYTSSNNLKGGAQHLIDALRTFQPRDGGSPVFLTAQRLKWIAQHYELNHFERGVRRLVNVKLNHNQFSSLVSFSFNLGLGNLQNSTLRMKLNREDYDGAADEFPKWRKAGGRILKGLVRRRAAERSLFLA